MDSHAPRSAAHMAAAIAVAALAAAPAVGATSSPPPQKKGATYSGVTSQGNDCFFNGQQGQPCSVSVKVSSDGKRVNPMQIRYRAACERNITFRSDTIFRNLSIKKGKFSKNASYPVTLNDGSTGTTTVSMHGKFTRKGKKYSVAGDYTAVSDLSFKDGTTAHCDSGKVTWKAKP